MGHSRKTAKKNCTTKSPETPPDAPPEDRCRWNMTKPTYLPRYCVANACYKVFEDQHTFVFMDIMPRSTGHCLVLPKRPARNILDADDAMLAQVYSTVRKISAAGMKAFEADGLTIQQFNEPAGGQIVFHLHVHVIPVLKGKDCARIPVKWKRPISSSKTPKNYKWRWRTSKINRQSHRHFRKSSGYLKPVS